jgi:hypothetical protein
MKIGKSFKASRPDGQGGFDSRGYYVELEPSDLGLPEPSSVEQARKVSAQLSHQAEALLLIEKAKAGMIAPQQMALELRPWVPPQST